MSSRKWHSDPKKWPHMIRIQNLAMNLAFVLGSILLSSTMRPSAVEMAFSDMMMKSLSAIFPLMLSVIFCMWLSFGFQYSVVIARALYLLIRSHCPKARLFPRHFGIVSLFLQCRIRVVSSFLQNSNLFPRTLDQRSRTVLVLPFSLV